MLFLRINFLIIEEKKVSNTFKGCKALPKFGNAFFLHSKSFSLQEKQNL